MAIKKEKVIISLDFLSAREALDLAKKLKGRVWGFKVNDLLFSADSGSGSGGKVGIIPKLKKYGKVFADAKLYDIPSTVGRSVKRLSEQGADMITVHCSGGIEMMKEAKKNAGNAKIIGVTVLTSVIGNVKNKVVKFAKDAEKAGLDGIVCSGHELKSLPRNRLLRIVPGIRPASYKKKDDQSRVMTPELALKIGADFLVVGRPIVLSEDPVKALKNL